MTDDWVAPFAIGAGVVMVLIVLGAFNTRRRRRRDHDRQE